MEKFFAVPLTLSVVLVAIAIGSARAGPACDEVVKDGASEVDKLFKNIQCTLEKAKPWVDEIEKEAKELEERSKIFGQGVISKLADMMEKWIEGDNGKSNVTEEASATEAHVVPVEVNEVGDGVPGKKCNDQDGVGWQGNC